MRTRGEEPTPAEAVSLRLKQLGEDIGRLVNDHIELAKAEARDAIRTTAKNSVLVVVGGLALALGYVLLAVACAIALGEVVGRARGFLLVSGGHVVVGLALVLIFARKLATKERPALPETAGVLSEDRRFVKTMRGALGDGGASTRLDESARL